MKYVFTALIAVAAVILLAAPATADWDPNDPDPRNATNHKMHWPQMPDYQTGLNVLATGLPDDFGAPVFAGKVLADDFRCRETGPITDIHIWGSWLNDIFPENNDSANGGDPFQDPGLVRFRLSLHGNIPDMDGPTGPDFSRPDEEFWHGWFDPGDFRVRDPENAPEGFFDPNVQEIIGTDTQVFQYNFLVDDPNAFQEVDKIYWLDVVAYPLGPAPAGALEEPVFGWKSARPNDRFMDDAVYGHMKIGDTGEPEPIGDWQPLKYPFGYDHPYEGQTMDLSFVITPEPGTVAMLIGAGLIGLLAYARRRRKS